MGDLNSVVLWDNMQSENIAAVAEFLSGEGKLHRAYIETFGCAANYVDSERLKGMLILMGYIICDDISVSDLVIYNTCAIREHAQNKVYSHIGELSHYKAANPNLIIAVCGCMAQQETVAQKIKKSYPFVNLVLGTNAVYKLPEHLLSIYKIKKRIFDLDEETHIFENLPTKRDGAFKGSVPIMYGCNNFCSYCIVPYVRGRERSREPEAVIREFNEMVNSGYKEITLIGQNVNSYGKGGEHGISFAKLLKTLAEIEGDFRLRFMTSHPRDCTDELFEVIRDNVKIVNHIHLPVQSGSDRILKLMNRHYTRDEYLSLIDRARKIIPNVTFTSDIIVGFPGETENDFLETMSLIKQVKYKSLFTFIFSPRVGTPAETMVDTTNAQDKKKWFAYLLKTQEEITTMSADKEKGVIYRVLCESVSKTKQGMMRGDGDNGFPVEFAGDESLIGTFVNVKITTPGLRIHGGEII